MCCSWKTTLLSSDCTLQSSKPHHFLCQEDDKLSLTILREDARMWNWTYSSCLTVIVLEKNICYSDSNMFKPWVILVTLKSADKIIMPNCS